jgi:hypothetical protein
MPAELHVIPRQPDGTWIVGIDPTSPALSCHATADEAQLAAAQVGARRVYLHDLYQRVRMIALDTV